jgi:hypothetical protein
MDECRRVFLNTVIDRMACPPLNSLNDIADQLLIILGENALGSVPVNGGPFNNWFYALALEYSARIFDHHRGIFFVFCGQEYVRAGAVRLLPDGDEGLPH